MSALAIVAIVFVILGVLACFVPRLPGVLSSYAGISCAWFDGTTYMGGTVVLFWSVATLLVIGIGVFAPREVLWGKRGNLYVVVGTMVGSLLGYVAAPTAASIITGSAIGAILGALAFRSTPYGPKTVPLYSHLFINFLCAAGLRAIVACSICGITIASVL